MNNNDIPQTPLTFSFHVPTQQYGFLEINGDVKDIKQAEALYNQYAEKPIDFGTGTVTKSLFVEMETFTGEKILYDELNHKYTTLDGKPLVSGSQYKKSLEKQFPLEMMAGKVSEKYGVPSQVVADMWKGNGLISTTFGTSLHLAMEQWFKFHKSGCEDKAYNLAKHPFLRGAVESFPLKDADALPEVLISDIAMGRVGRIDLLTITGEFEGYVDDYKTDADIAKNLEGHFNQLSFYASILVAKGWNIKGVRVWNYTSEWTLHQSEVLPIKNNK